MVADATTTDRLPPDAPVADSRITAALDSETLLSALLTNHLDVLKTALETSTPVGQLLAWSARADIQQLIETFRQLQFASVNMRLLARTADARIETVARLHECAKTITDPIELRRNSTLVLRYSTPLRPWTPRATEMSSSRCFLTPDSTDHRATERSSSRCSPITDPTTPRATEMSSSRCSPTPDCTDHRATEMSSSRCSSITDPNPLPHFTTPSELLRHFERSLIKQRPTTPATRTTATQNLHRYLAPSTSLDPATEADLIAHVISVQVKTTHSDTLSHTATLYITRHRQPLIRADITLSRSSEAEPWRITAIRGVPSLRAGPAPSKPPTAHNSG